MLIIGGAVIVARAILGAVFGEPEASDGPVASGDATADTTTTTEAGLPSVGDAVRDGKFEFVVTSIEQPGIVYQSPGGLKDEANGRWFVVQMTVENIGDAEQTFLAGNQKILWDDMKYGGETFTWNGTNGEDLNPGVVLDATVLFDLPKGSPNAASGAFSNCMTRGSRAEPTFICRTAPIHTAAVR